MKILVDSSAGRRLTNALQTAGHDVVFSKDLGPDPGDAALIEIAATESRTVVTVDQNFGRAIIFGDVPNIGIVFIPDVTPDQRIRLVTAAIEAHERDLEAGAWVVAEVGRMRLRMPPGTGDS
ncbi:MAG: DUF5615 family PIN-like protein [Planctomycetes bacterium]|nr:DUF5615 family PIN-like protein [Planctomycetota bacterium]